jgi:hypothetical protein
MSASVLLGEFNSSEDHKRIYEAEPVRIRLTTIGLRGRQDIRAPDGAECA